MNAKNQAMLASYGRAALVAIITAVSMGKTDPRDIITAALIAVAAPALRALNPKDGAFGVGADLLTVELTKLAKPTAKKATVKK
jgi:hypothetical protein